MVSASATMNHVVDERLVEQRRADAGAQAGNHPRPGSRPEGHRAHAVHRDDPHRAVPLAEVAGAAHQGAGGSGADEQDVEGGELAGDGGRGAAVVGPPVVRVRVLVEPDVAVVGRAQPADVVEPGAEQPADSGSGSVDDVHLGAECLHQPPGGQVAAASRSRTRSGSPCSRRSCSAPRPGSRRTIRPGSSPVAAAARARPPRPSRRRPSASPNRRS